METLVGDYRLLSALGEGAAGTVHLATPTTAKPFAKPGDLVAIKVYKETVLQQPNQLERVQREFRAASQLAHPAVVRMFECNIEDRSRPFLVMEYVDGMPLDKWVLMFYPPSDYVLLQIAIRIAEGLAEIHEAGLIHRDLKPENIMLSSAFEPKIMDFGVVHSKAESGKTPPNKFLGTIRYSSPELLRARSDTDYDARTDLYSFGTVLYCMLHGQQLFANEAQFVRLSELVKDAEPEFGKYLTNRSGPSPQLLELTKQLLSKRADDLLPNASSLVQRLREIGEAAGAKVVEPLHGYSASALTGLSSDAREAILFKSKQIADVCKEFEIYVYQPRKATDPVLNPDVKAEAVY